MDHEALLDTIRRLLALSGSPNEHEARAALAKAHELLARHNLDLAEVQAEPSGESFGDEVVSHGGRKPAETLYVTAICEQFFFVRFISRTQWDAGQQRRVQTLMLFGRKENLPVGQHVYRYLSETFVRLWREYCGKNPGCSQRERRTYYLGLFEGLRNRLERERREMTRQAARHDALVVVHREIDAAMRTHYGRIREERHATPLTGSMGAYLAGRVRGANIEIHRPLPAAGPALLTKE
jgi:hypothetical protein